MRRIGRCLLAAGLCLAATLASAAEPEKPEEEIIDLTTLAGDGPRFRVGEKFRYRIHWTAFHVGTSVVEVKDIQEVDGHPCYHVVARTRSNKIISSFYPVNDTVESFIDVEGMFTRRFIKKLNEGGYHCDEETIFDVENGVAHWQSYLNGKTKDYEIPARPQDSLSLVYYLRGFQIEQNKKYRTEVCADEKVFEVIIESRKRKTLRVPRSAGTRRKAIEVEPKAKFKGLFVRKGRMWVWVSDDDQRLLLRMVTKIPVASIRMVLTGAENIGPAEGGK